ncbi:patatin-like phospholipase family protein [Amycolatopsis sp. 195334CR]|uniref:patatin-like phospholipase family protein n=1 Tax=Amycolatopsis sp. 195334CR TaxID=2814588 RepID=UPI001A8F16B0|nr:patatin-like phospholipase family protein [Amycolatopsis sp. 195334CR]MBN6038333.1 patatin-like phospholipase family protein [Amycolatopsis sp. 195334CR]
MTRRGLAIGCGGTLGFAWTAVALEAVERELGWDPRTADVLIGTSAGSELVALLGSGRSASDILSALDGDTDDDVLAAHLAHLPGIRPPLPSLSWPARRLVLCGLRGRVDFTAAAAGLLPGGRGNPAWLRDLGARLAGPDDWVPHPATWIVAADAGTGERVAFGSPGAPRAGLGDVLAASWAIPGWFPPVPIGGRNYLDGGTISSVSADLAGPLGLAELVVVAPMTSGEAAPATGLARVERLLRRRMTAGLDREIAALRAAGTRVIRIEPGPGELAAMGFNFMNHRHRPATLSAARRHVPARVRAAIRQGAPS